MVLMKAIDRFQFDNDFVIDDNVGDIDSDVLTAILDLKGLFYFDL